MDWQEIRKNNPSKWVVIEALDASTEGASRIINHLDLIGAFEDWQSAWGTYKTLHHENKFRELYCLHTDRVELEIGVLDSFGRIIVE